MTSTRRRAGTAALWPWPGTIFLALLSGWLLYMGRIATVADVKSAFYGLSIVSALTMLLGLRAALTARARRLRSDAAVRAALAARRPGPFANDAETALPPRVTPEQGSELPVRSNVTPMFKLQSPVSDGDDAGEAILELEAALNRERADRGAQIVKLEQQIAALSTRLERAGGDGGDTGALEDRILALEAKARDRVERQEFASLVARLGLMEKRTAAEAPDMSGYLRVEAFNNAVSERLLPRMHQIVANALKGGGGAGDGGAEDDAAPAGAAPLRGDRAALENEIRRVREIATKAWKVARNRPATEGAAPEEFAALKAEMETDRREIAELKAALAARGDGAETSAGGGVKRRLAALEAQLERFAGAEAALTEVREALSALGARAARAEDGAREALRRIDALASGGGMEAPEAPADVAALRDALTTIIEQNRELRAQQERLSARFEPKPVDAAP